MTNFLNTAILSKVVDKRRPVQMTIWDKMFTETHMMDSNTIAIDVLTDDEGIAQVVSPGAQSRKASQVGWESQTLTIPRFSEHDFVKAGDISGLRTPGSNAAEQLMAVYVRKMDGIRARFDRTKEFMAMKALLGTIVDGGGRTLASWTLPAAVNVDFASVDALDAMDNATLAISRALGGPTGEIVAFCGATAFQNLRGNAQVQDLLSGPAGPGMIENGQLAKVGGVTIIRVPWVYKDNTGATQKFLADDKIVIAPTTGLGARVFGPCETPDGLVKTEWFVDTEKLKDPPATKIRVETNPIPVPLRPNAIYTITDTTA